MGLLIKIPDFVSTDPSAPRLPVIDPIESAGSLYLVEPAHPAGTWGSGVPASGATVPNLFAATLGIAAPTLVIGGGIASTPKGKVERSAKGGLHVIVSQATALSSGDGVALMWSGALRDYLIANTSHDFYISTWDRLTRAQLDHGTVPITQHAVLRASDNARGLAGAYPGGWSPTSITPGTIGGKVTLDNTPGARFANVEVLSFDPPNTPAGVAGAAGPIWGAAANTIGAGHVATRNQKYESKVFYRFYIEDLTVSGRTYAQVSAIDQQEYTKHVLTPGGRYYGDTFTDPATIP